jgi:hypothetical protein
LTGNGNLSTALRYATVAKIIEFKDQLHLTIVDRFKEFIKTIYSDDSYYKCQLIDLTFSAGIAKSFIKRNINEIRFPQHLIDAQLDPNEKSTIHWATLFHQFIASMVTNRPIHCYGVMVDKGQRILWKSEFADRSPINFMHVDGNHYVALLPKSGEEIHQQKYTYHSLFLSAFENQAFRQREPQDIPANEEPFCEDCNEVITVE